MRGDGMRGLEVVGGISDVYIYIDWVYVKNIGVGWMDICFSIRRNWRLCDIQCLLGHGSYAALVKNLEGLLDWDSLDARSICIQYHCASRS